MNKSIDDIDLKILKILQDDCKISIKKLSTLIGMPLTTTYNRIKKLKKMGYIKGCYTLLDPHKLNYPTLAFILVSFEYKIKKGDEILSQRDIAKKIARIKGVQEVHIISGEWDMIIKVRGKNIRDIGNLVLDELRLIEGIQKTVTCLVFDTAKETLHLDI